MNFYYCQSCFKKTPQTSSIITKCSHCGAHSTDTSISNISANNRLVPEINSKEYRQEIINRAEKKGRIRAEIEMGAGDIDEDENENNLDIDDNDAEDENVSVPNINKLKIEVDIPENSGIPIRSLAKGSTRKTKTKTKGKKIDKQQFLADFQKSASTLRKNK